LQQKSRFQKCSDIQLPSGHVLKGELLILWSSLHTKKFRRIFPRESYLKIQGRHKGDYEKTKNKDQIKRIRPQDS